MYNRFESRYSDTLYFNCRRVTISSFDDKGASVFIQTTGNKCLSLLKDQVVGSVISRVNSIFHFQSLDIPNRIPKLQVSAFFHLFLICV